jgi:hypothetical protein
MLEAGRDDVGALICDFMAAETVASERAARAMP